MKKSVWRSLNECFSLPNCEPPEDWCENFTLPDGTLTGWHHSEELKQSISEGVKLAYAEGRLVPQKEFFGCRLPKSKEHKRNISEALKKAHAEGRRKPPIPKRFTEEELKERIREQNVLSSRSYYQRNKEKINAKRRNK